MDSEVWIEASVSWGILATQTWYVHSGDVQVLTHYRDTSASLVGCLHELSVNINI
jgi:hypothetical protein